MKVLVAVLAATFVLSCGKGKSDARSVDNSLARMYVAALEVDSLKSAHDLPENYPTPALTEIGQPYGWTGDEMKRTLTNLKNDPEAKAVFDSLVKTAIEEATIRSINERDTLN